MSDSGISEMDSVDYGDVRAMLSTAVAKDENQHRDIVGSAVEIVRRRRRRTRTFGAAASGVAVAMGATAVVWVGGSSVPGHPAPAASSTTTTSSPTSGAVPSEWDKEHDVLDRLPGLVNPLLPHGFSVTKPGSSPYPTTGDDFVLNGPSGTNDLHLTVSTKADRNRAMETGCVVGGVCTNKQIPGGTLYISTKNFAADYGGNSGYAPGTGKQVLSFADEYEFVPSAADGMVIDVTMAATVSLEHYAAHPPSDWPSGQWPPPTQSGGSFDSSGVLMSPDDFATLIAKPGFGAVTRLLDPSTPVSAATVAKHKAADATIAAAVKPILPPGVTLAIATGEVSPGDYLTLNGPSGANMFSWTTEPQSKSWKHGQACQSHTAPNCTWKEVPGGEIEVTHTSDTGTQGSPDLYAPGQATTPFAGGDVFRYLPDDPNGTVVSISTAEQFRDIPWAATRPTTGPWADPGQPWPPAARDGEAFNPGGALLNADQFAALAQTPGIVDIVQTVNNALNTPGGAVLQQWG